MAVLDAAKSGDYDELERLRHAGMSFKNVEFVSPIPNEIALNRIHNL